ncbi:MAG: DUF3769 domain-containing protein [Spirulinaceae cyanobacterium SM2_1_0]|nr:DUF3769 domain-containing protein [Spirulinaceae cyanobacterium SM2_1_0]
MSQPAPPPESAPVIQVAPAAAVPSIFAPAADALTAAVAAPPSLPITTERAIASPRNAPPPSTVLSGQPDSEAPSTVTPGTPTMVSDASQSPETPSLHAHPPTGEPKALRALQVKPSPSPWFDHLERDLAAVQTLFTLSGAATPEKTSSEGAVSEIFSFPMHVDLPPPAPEAAIAQPAELAAAATDPNVLPPASGAPGTASELGRPISIGYTPPPDVFGVLPDFAIEPSYNFAPLTIELPAPATAPLATLDQAQLDWGEAAGSLQPTPPARLRAQSRDGELREFEFRSPAEEAADTVDEAEEAGAAATEADTEDGRTELERLIEDPPRVPEPAPLPDATVEPADAIEISADRQQFNERQRIVTAQGEVVVRLAKGILTADRVRVNLPNRYLVAEGDVALRRGEQVLRGDRFEYQIVQDQGIVFNARGEVNQRRTDLDFAPVLANDPAADTILPTRPLSDRVLADQPVVPTPEEGFQLILGGLSVQSNPDGTLGSPTVQTGTRGDVYRVRFEADYVEFDSEGWQATNIRFTNDPFSPPELEVRADTAELTRLNEFQDEIITTNSRLVFDQVFSVPIFQDRILIDRREQEPGLFNIGFDDDDRGGLFIERGFTIVNTPRIRWRLTPQYFVQRAIFEEGFLDLDSLGVRSNFDVFFDERTTLTAATSLTSLDVTRYRETLRNDLRLQRALGRLDRPHFLTLQYTFRDRLFNGSLGFQTVQSSFGAIFTSPVIALGTSGVNLTYQASVQRITADTDRADLLLPDREDDRITLTRYQGAASVTRGFTLWSGEALPPTPDEGLRFTPRPVRPFVNLTTGLTTVAARYSNGDRQELVSGTIGLQGQFGHFSRSYLDYTAFNVSYSNSLVGDRSPFLFDRFVDQQVVSFGVTQQLYGPFRVGFQTSYNLDTGQEISTDYTLEYSRRTFGVILRYNPVLSVASFLVRVGDFNWLGTPEPFGGSGIRSVVQGVTR